MTSCQGKAELYKDDVRQGAEQSLAERFDRAKARLGEVEDGIVAKQAQREMMQNLVDTLGAMPDAVDSFDEGAWYALVDHATVYGRDDVRFTFKNGMEIKV